MNQATNFAERRVRVRVGAAGDRDHRGELGVAQAGEDAADAGDDERQDDRGAGVLGGGEAGEHEDAGADDAADADRGQRDRARAFGAARPCRLRPRDLGWI